MKKYLKPKFILSTLLILFIVIQLYRPSQENPEWSVENDFIHLAKPDKEVGNIIKTSCYDCHSYQTKYPWYYNVAPVSWIMASHIKDARKHFNLSEWSGYDLKKKDHKLEEAIEEVEEGEMPLKGYVKFHPEADLNLEQKKLLLSWLKEYRANLNE